MPLEVRRAVTFGAGVTGSGGRRGLSGAPVTFCSLIRVLVKSVSFVKLHQALYLRLDYFSFNVIVG